MLQVFCSSVAFAAVIASSLPSVPFRTFADAASFNRWHEQAAASFSMVEPRVTITRLNKVDWQEAPEDLRTRLRLKNEGTGASHAADDFGVTTMMLTQAAYEANDPIGISPASITSLSFSFEITFPTQHESSVDADEFAQAAEEFDAFRRAFGAISRRFVPKHSGFIVRMEADGICEVGGETRTTSADRNLSRVYRFDLPPSRRRQAPEWYGVTCTQPISYVALEVE